MATITMTREEWDQELANRHRVEKEVANLRVTLEQHRLDTMNIAGGGTVEALKLDELVRQAMFVVRFAVANLPPEMTPGWPVDSLKRVVDNLDALPTYSTDDADLRNELLAFVKEIEVEEARRRRAKT